MTSKFTILSRSAHFRCAGIHRRSRGFSLIEIMIALLIVGLLAAMAIPAIGKIQKEVNLRMMANDGRQIGGAANQYFTENTGHVTVSISVLTDRGQVVGALSDYVKVVSRGTQIGNFNSQAEGSDPAFTMQNPKVRDGMAVPFDRDGKMLE